MSSMPYVVEFEVVFGEMRMSVEIYYPFDDQ